MEKKKQNDIISNKERTWALEAIQKSYEECYFQWQIERLNQMQNRYTSEEFPISREEFNSDIRLMMSFYGD